MLRAEGRALAEAGHVTAQVVDPGLGGAAFVLIGILLGAAIEEEHIGLHAGGVENTSG